MMVEGHSVDLWDRQVSCCYCQLKVVYCACVCYCSTCKSISACTCMHYVSPYYTRRSADIYTCTCVCAAYMYVHVHVVLPLIHSAQHTNTIERESKHREKNSTDNGCVHVHTQSGVQLEQVAIYVYTQLSWHLHVHVCTNVCLNRSLYRTCTVCQ